MNWVATVYDLLRRPMCEGMRRKGEHSQFSGRPFSLPYAAQPALQFRAGISRLTAVLPIQRVLNPPGGAASP